MTEIKRLFDFPYYQLNNQPLEACLVTKYNGEWVKTSTQEYIDKANAISRALLKLGVENDVNCALLPQTILGCCALLLPMPHRIESQN